MSFASVNGQRIYFEDTGGSGAPVILSHGFLMDHAMFEHQVAALRDDYRVITWDERGFGQTEWDGKPFSYWDSADDCMALLTHLGIERAVLGGMSQGGFLSLRAALRYPERVRGLILIDTQAGDEKEAAELYRGMLGAWATDGPSDELAYAVAQIIISDPVENLRWIARWQARDHASIVEPGNCLLNREDIGDRLNEIHCPAVIIHGLADAAIPLEKAQHMRVGLPGFQHLEIIDNAGHASNLTHPEQANRAIRNFLADLK
jgi:3-oxoadipate enol-lactonase